jgi:hypothetical protein
VVLIKFVFSLSTESLNFKKPGESNNFIFITKRKIYDTHQAEQKHLQTSNKTNTDLVPRGKFDNCTNT